MFDVYGLYIVLLAIVLLLVLSSMMMMMSSWSSSVGGCYEHPSALWLALNNTK